MARLAAKITPRELWDCFQNKIKEKFGDREPYLYSIVSEIGKIGKDISKVKFNFENSYYQVDDSLDRKLGVQQAGDLSYIGCQAGGDWEYPVYFVIYLDQDKTTFRGYVPFDGNTWNHDTKMAFGNSEESDSKFLAKWVKKK